MKPTTNGMWPRGRTGAATVAALCALALSAGGAYALRIVEVHHSNPKRVPAPSLVDKPNRQTDLRWALFTFGDRQTQGSFQCSLDGSSFTICPRRVVYGLVERTTNAPLGCTSKHSKPTKPSAKRCQSSHNRRLSNAQPISRRRRQRGGRITLMRVCGQGRSAAKNAGRPGASKPGKCQRAYIEGVGRLLPLGSHTFRVRFRAPNGTLSGATTYTWSVLTKAQLEALERASSTTGSTGAGGGGGGAGTGASGGNGSTGSTGTNGGGSSPAPVVRTKSFVITGQPEGTLYPGGAALPIPLKLFNPNPLPIDVTALTVSVVASPAGCSAEENLRITQSSASGSTPIVVPADGSVTLPAQGASAPTIQFLNLPVNQDACKSASFPLDYSGSAHS